MEIIKSNQDQSLLGGKVGELEVKLKICISALFKYMN
jgi:hypothetical protein